MGGQECAESQAEGAAWVQSRERPQPLTCPFLGPHGILPVLLPMSGDQLSRSVHTYRIIPARLSCSLLAPLLSEMRR